MHAVAYYRVSTAKQGRSGLGLEAQRRAVEAYCAQRGLTILDDYTEVESGGRNDRPELSAALHRAKTSDATLVIAKLDRLSRNAAFLLTLQDSGARFAAADMPEASNLTVGIMALVAQQERDAISERTRAALAAAKARGTRLGNPNGAAALRRAGKGNAASAAARKAKADAFARDLAPVLAGLRSEGMTSLRQLATALNKRAYRTPRGGKWHPATVRDLAKRVANLPGD